MIRRKCRSLIIAVILFSVILLPRNTASAEDRAEDYSVEILSAGYTAAYNASEHDSDWYTEDAVYARMMAMRSSYPEGMPWTNDNSYENTYLWYGGEWSGYSLHYTGYGCAGFALIMSDAAFGDELPMWQNYNVSFSKIRTGDILRINGNTHSVIVLSVNDDSVTIAEGNYNSSIHWGRTLSAAEVNQADYVLTRWPSEPDGLLPNSLGAIQDEAFKGVAFRVVKLSDQTTSIGRDAFANCTNLSYIDIPAATTSIDSSAFNGTSGLTIIGKEGSTAVSFAQSNGFGCIVIP